MSAKDNGGPAFPRSFSKAGEYRDSAKHNAQEGMTLRDYFAAKAMQGLCAHPELGHNPYVKIAEAAYHQADAMMLEREK